MDGSDTPTFRYRAFITYCHRDERWARWLHSELESYRIPQRLVGRSTLHGTVPGRLGPLFRDREELSTSADLGAAINAALEQSANLIVICSPAAAASNWVDLETKEFQRLGRSRRIFCVIVGGEPFASGRVGTDAQECFPPSLRLIAGSDGVEHPLPTEPIAADLREGKDGKFNAKLKLIAGLLGLEFDALKQREQQRHIRRLTAGAVASAAIAAITIALAVSSMVERNAAQRRQKQAENLVEFMLGDLYDKLYKLQRLDLLTTVNDRSMAYFGALPTADQSDGALTLRIRAMTKIGNMRLDQGNSAAALAAYQRALDLATPQIAVAPKDATLQIRQAELFSYVGMAYWRQGDLSRAEASFGSAQHMLEHQLADTRQARDPQVLIQLASVDNNIGHVFEARGRFGDAANRYRAMESVCRTLVAIDPNNADWMENFGLAHNNLGKMSLLHGDLVGAIMEYQEDDAIEAKLYENDLNDTSRHEQLSAARAIFGRTVALAGRIDSGIEKLTAAANIAEQIVAQDATATYAQEDLAWYSVQLSRLLRERGDHAQALALVNRSLGIFNSLARADPANADWQLELGQTLVERAEFARAQSDEAAIRDNTAAALAILDLLYARQPGDRSTLLAELAARLLRAGAYHEDPVLQRDLRASALTMIQVTSSGRGDPRLLALQAEALLANGQRDEAMPVIAKLQTSGYRELSFMGLLSGLRIEFPVNQSVEDRMAAFLGEKPVMAFDRGSAQRLPTKVSK